MDVLEAFDRGLAEVDALVGAVTPGQSGDPTPCAEWDVRAMLNHQIPVNLLYAAMAEGRPLPPADTDFVGDDHVEAFRRSGRTARVAFSRVGMQEQGYRFPWGEWPGAKIVEHVTNELHIHGWDLARATGHWIDIAPDLAEWSLGSWRVWFGDRPRGASGLFDPEQPVPEGTGTADRLTPFLGRRF